MDDKIILPFVFAIFLFASPAHADPKRIPMPKELLGWWYDTTPHEGIDIRPDEIVEQIRKTAKPKDICRYKYKMIRHFPDERETYLMTAYYCEDPEPLFLSYEKVVDEPIKELHQGPYQHIRIYRDSVCKPHQADWDHFNANKAWNDILTNPHGCEGGVFHDGSSSPYERE